MKKQQQKNIGGIEMARKNKKRNKHRKEATTPILHIGFIGGFPDVFINIVLLFYEGSARAIRWSDDDFCIKHLPDFIRDYMLTEIFIAPDVHLYKIPISEYETELEHIGKLTNCVIKIGTPTQ